MPALTARQPHSLASRPPFPTTRRGARQVVQGAADLQAFMDRLALFKSRGGLQLEGVQHAVGDFRISLARAVQVRAALRLAASGAAAGCCIALQAAHHSNAAEVEALLSCCLPPSLTAHCRCGACVFTPFCDSGAAAELPGAGGGPVLPAAG
jgi:hypothetical protein